MMKLTKYILAVGATAAFCANTASAQSYYQQNPYGGYYQNPAYQNAYNQAQGFRDGFMTYPNPQYQRDQDYQRGLRGGYGQ